MELAGTAGTFLAGLLTDDLSWSLLSSLLAITTLCTRQELKEEISAEKVGIQTDYATFLQAWAQYRNEIRYPFDAGSLDDYDTIKLFVDFLKNKNSNKVAYFAFYDKNGNLSEPVEFNDNSNGPKKSDLLIDEATDDNIPIGNSDDFESYQ